MQELGTFGAIITFAVALEEQAEEFYKGLIHAKFPQAVDEMLRGSSKRINRLKRIRQELVTEMILEPINGISGGDYWVDRPDSFEDANIVGQAISVEKNLSKFYESSAPLIPMKEVQRAFTRLAKENDKRVAKLEALE